MEGQGAYAAAATFSSVWAMVALCGVDTAHTYYLAGRRYPRGAVLGNSLAWIAILAGIATPLYLAATPWLKQNGGADFGSVLVISAIAVPLTIARYFVLAFFLGSERIDRFNLLNVLSSLLLLALLVFALVFRTGGAEEAVAAYVASLGLLVVLGVVWIAREPRVRSEDPIEVSRSLLREAWSYGMRGHAGVFFTTFTYRFDQLLVTRMAGLEAQGFYSIAVLLAEKLSHIPASIQLVLFPRVAAGSVEQSDILTPRACRLTLFTVGLGAVVLYFAGAPLIRLLYSRVFESSVPAFHVLLPGIVALSLAKPLSGDLSGRNRRVGQTIVFASAFALNLGLDLVWIPRHGIVGAAWASSIAYAWQTLLLCLLFWRATGIPPWKLVLPTAADWRWIRQRLPRAREIRASG